MTTYLSDIGFLAGDPVPLGQLDGVAPDLAERLCADGLGTARVFSQAPWRMAADCARMTLATAEAVLDTVVYACEGRRDHPQNQARDTARFMAAAGVEEQTVVGAGLNTCANLGALLLSACALVDSGHSQACLLVTVDSAGPDDRVVNGDIGVFSDAAASAMVGPRLPAAGGFEVVAVERASSARLGLVALMQEDRRAASSFLVRVNDAMLRLVDRSGIQPHGFKHVLSNNYATSAIGALHAIVNAPLGAAYRGTARDYAHCFAADGLLNLDHMRRAGSLSDGDDVLLLSTAANSWFVIALRYRDA